MTEQPDQPDAPAPDDASQPDPEALREQVLFALKSVYDPEIPVNIFELGLIYRVDVDEQGHVEIDMTLTAPNCPAAQSLPQEVETRTAVIRGVKDVNLQIVWDPPWNPDMMSDAAKLELGMM
jgi:FeS assembly SUF system protein